MNASFPFRTAHDFLGMSFTDQLCWILQGGQLVSRSLCSAAYRIGELLVVLRVDEEEQYVEEIQAYMAPGLQ